MIIIGISGKAQNGKTTLCQGLKPYFEAKGYRTDIQPLAKIMKEQAKNIGWDGNKDERGRRLLQQISWPIKNYHGEHIYAQWALEEAEGKKLDIMLIDDVRMLAEINFYKKCVENGRIEKLILARVERPGHVSGLTPEQLADCSETQLDDYPFEIYIENNGTIEEFHKKGCDIIGSLV